MDEIDARGLQESNQLFREIDDAVVNRFMIILILSKGFFKNYEFYNNRVVVNSREEYI